MSKRPWYKRFGADFVHGALGLSLEEKGAYSVILDLIYDRGGPIPDDARWIAGVCNCSLRKWAVVRAELIRRGKLYEVDGLLSNRRADRELSDTAEMSDERAGAGAKGGRKRAENAAKTRRKLHENASKRHDDFAENVDEASEINNLEQAELKLARAFHIPEARSQSLEGSDLRSSPSSRSVAPAELSLSSETGPPSFDLVPSEAEARPAPAKANGSRPPGFDDFWQHYPRKVGKDAAPKAYAAALKRGATPAEILRGAMRYAAEREREDPGFTKHPSTWLNAGCWADEPAPRAPRAGEAAARAAMAALGVTEEDFR